MSIRQLGVDACRGCMRARTLGSFGRQDVGYTYDVASLRLVFARVLAVERNAQHVVGIDHGPALKTPRLVAWGTRGLVLAAAPETQLLGRLTRSRQVVACKSRRPSDCEKHEHQQVLGGV